MKEIVLSVLGFIKQNDYIIGILGLFISALGVYYGRKAYRTALDIFNKGIQIDENKIFSQIGLEFVLKFIVPYSQLKENTEDIWNREKYSSMDLITIYNKLEKNKFEAEFPYLEEHKGDLWNALEHRKKESDNVTESFRKILIFSESAKDLNNGILNLDKTISKYIGEKHKEDPNVILTFADFSRENANGELIDRGIALMEEIDQEIASLPEELGIDDKRRNLDI